MRAAVMGPAERAVLRRLTGALGLVAMAGAAAAQGLGLGLGGGTGNQPIEIQADSGIEWQQDAQLYIARGNAVATRGAMSVRSDVLTARYRPTAPAGGVKPAAPAASAATGGQPPPASAGPTGSTEIYRVNADGNVTMTEPGRTVVGDQAVYDVDQQVVVVTGKNLKMTSGNDWVTSRDSLEWYDQKQVAVARGDAVLARDTRRLRGDVVTAYFTKDKPKPGNQPAAGSRQRNPAKPPAAEKANAGPGSDDSRISRVDAQGHVVVSTLADVSRGDYGVYNADTGIVTLIGNVTITRQQNEIRGQYAVVDLNTNISRMLTYAAGAGAPPPRVQGLFVRDSAAAAGATPGTSPPTPPAAAPAASAGAPPAGTAPKQAAGTPAPGAASAGTP